MIPIAEQAKGRWRAILPAFGIGAEYLGGKHGPCPMCGGRDRWRFDDKDGRGSWFCSHCGAGDGTKLVMLRTGLEFKEAAAQIAKVAGTAPIETAKKGRPPEERRRLMNRVWEEGQRITLGTPAGLYLQRRIGLADGFPRALRALTTAMYRDGASKTFHPAMIAKVTDACGQPVNIHRTFLTSDGRKAALADPRRLMEGTMPPGAAIRLLPVAPHIGIAEGIETALSAAALFGVPTWAAVNAGRLAAWLPPPEVERVTIFGDADDNFVGQAAAYALAAKLRARKIEVDVRIPDALGSDWNDALAPSVPPR